jgi:hypothetical protein
VALHERIARGDGGGERLDRVALHLAHGALHPVQLATHLPSHGTQVGVHVVDGRFDARLHLGRAEGTGEEGRRVLRARRRG